MSEHEPAKTVGDARHPKGKPMPQYEVDLTDKSAISPTSDPGHRTSLSVTADDPEHAKRLTRTVYGPNVNIHGVTESQEG